jgi:hypothetical protein
VFENETQWRAALVEAQGFQRRELIHPGEGECCGADRPGIGSQPHLSFHLYVQDGIADVDHTAKQHPNAEIAPDKQQHQVGAIQPLARDAVA